MRTRTYRFVAGLLAVGMAVAACGSDSEEDTGGSDEPAGTDAAAPSDDTEAAAATDAASDASGTMVWWSNLTIEQTEAMIDEFNKAHPDITVEYTRQDDAEGYEKFTTASEAGQGGPDVMQIGWDGFSKEWAGKGYLLEYISPESEPYPAEIKGAKGEYYTYGSLLEGICYNTERLSEKGLTAPDSWEDLADPQYKGEITMQDPLKVGSGAHDLMIETRVFWDDDERWETFWAGYGANDVNIQIGYTEAQQQLIQGNYAILGLCYLDYVQPSIAEGAPVVWVPVEPVITVPFTIQIPTNAENPDAAKAFIDWMLSETGQAAVAEIAGQVPARPGAPFPEAAKAAEGFTQQPALGTPRAAEEYNTNAEFYVEKAKEWFNLR